MRSHIGQVDPTLLILAAAIGLVAYIAARKAAAATDITSRDNIANTIFNDVTKTVTGDDRSLGSRFSDHCVQKALENGGRIPEDLPWYCPAP